MFGAPEPAPPPADSGRVSYAQLRAAAASDPVAFRAFFDLTVARLPGVDFVEVVAENVAPDRAPATLLALRARGVPVVPHGVSLSPGGAARPDRSRLSRLAALAETFSSPLPARLRAAPRRTPRSSPATCSVPGRIAAVSSAVPRVA